MPLLVGIVGEVWQANPPAPAGIGEGMGRTSVGFREKVLEGRVTPASVVVAVFES